MVDSLRPCPFCGGDAVGPHEISDGAGYGLFEIFCLGPNKNGPGCGAVTTSHATEVEATAAWNTRTKAISRTGAVKVKALDDARQLLAELKTFHANDAGDRAIQILRRLVEAEPDQKPTEGDWVSGEDMIGAYYGDE